MQNREREEHFSLPGCRPNLQRAKWAHRAVCSYVTHTHTRWEERKRSAVNVDMSSGSSSTATTIFLTYSTRAACKPAHRLIALSLARSAQLILPATSPLVADNTTNISSSSSPIQILKPTDQQLPPGGILDQIPHPIPPHCARFRYLPDCRSSLSLALLRGVPLSPSLQRVFFSQRALSSDTATTTTES